jgi:3-deoxy-D-manno-octulosonic-acid transferase
VLSEESEMKGSLLAGNDPPPIHYSVGMLLRDTLYTFAFILYVPILIYQSIVHKKVRRGWDQRFGHIPCRPSTKRRIWIHAVSLGEINATRTLTDQIRQRFPEFEIVISTSTETGYAAALRHYPDNTVFRYPLDFSWVVRGVLNRVRPSAIILMELEVWPNLIELASVGRIPVGIANGRVTQEKSMRRYNKPLIRGVARKMFSRIAWVGAQDETYAARFRELGVPPERVNVSGNLKYDTADTAETVNDADELALSTGIDRTNPLLVAGSTGPGEEAILLDIFKRLSKKIPGLQMAIIPRKPERFDEVARLIESKGFICVRRSACPENRAASGSGDCIVLGDTMGELRKFYSLANAVFVGRTLVPMGGSDLMEVAGLAKPMCFGPHVENFSDVAEKLLQAHAARQVRNQAELEKTLELLIEQKSESAAMGQRARQVVMDNQGATTRTVDLLLNNLPQSAGHMIQNLKSPV